MRRYETRSTMMTSNRPLEDWGKLIGDVPSATAILDRFLHHAEVVTITGKSYRLRNQAAKAPAEDSKPAKAPPGSGTIEAGPKPAKAPPPARPSPDVAIQGSRLPPKWADEERPLGEEKPCHRDGNADAGKCEHL